MCKRNIGTGTLPVSETAVACASLGGALSSVPARHSHLMWASFRGNYKRNKSSRSINYNDLYADDTRATCNNSEAYKLAKVINCLHIRVMACKTK